jgi:hypothetical protein
VFKRHVSLTIFQTAAQMEGLAHQEEGERRRLLQENLIADHEADANQFASPDFMRLVKENELTADDQKVVSTMLQRVC